MIEYHGWPERLVFLKYVQGSKPLICRQAVHCDYSSVILTTLASNQNEVDVSCNTSDGDDFCGNPIFREKVNLRISDFIQAWSQHRQGLQHWILEAGLQLYLSQCCLSCPTEPSNCDLDTEALQVQCPSVLEQNGISCAQTNLWMNIHQARSTLHYDGSDNLLVLARGVKHVTIISPEYTKYIRPAPASDDNPNHSSMSFHEVEVWMDEFSIASRNGAQSPNIYKIVLQEGDALYIPEGWWHQVYSEPGSMALNFWFTTSTSEAGGRDNHRQSYMLRNLVHSMLAEERAVRSKQVGQLVVSPIYSQPLSYQAFESRLLALVSATGHAQREGFDGVGKPPAAEVSGGYPEGRERRPNLQPDTRPKRARTAEEGRVTEKGAEESFWLEFVQCGVDEQRALWIPFACAHPEEWHRVLLSLNPEACANLLDYWDTLRPAEGEPVEGHAPSGPGELAQDQTNAGAVTKGALERSTAVRDLDGFFECLFAPCGENTTQVRRHLIQQKNVHNEEAARRLMSEVLGMNLK